MATTTFVDNVTAITAEWLNDVNAATYSGTGVYASTATGGVPSTIKNKLGETVSVKDFGAKGDGTTDDAVAIRAAIAAVAAAGGGEVYFPMGTYKCASNIAVTTNFVRLTGTGKYGSRLYFTTTTGHCLSFTGSSLAMCGVKSLGIYVAAQTSGSLIAAEGVFRFSIEDVFLCGAVGTANYPAGLAYLKGTDVVVDNCDFIGARSFGIKCFEGNDYFLTNTTVQMNGVVGSGLYLKGVAGGAILCNNCAFLTGAYCYFEGSKFLTFTNTYFDSAQGGVVVTSCHHVYFTNCEFANRVDNGGTGDGYGAIFGDSKNFVLAQCMVINCGKSGVVVNSSCHDFTITGCHFDGNNTTNSDNQHGLLIGGDASNFQVIGNRAGNIPHASNDLGFSGHQKYGIALGGGGTSNNYIIRDNIVLNNETWGLIDGGGGTNAVVENNIGYNPVGLASVTPPASTVAYRAGHTSETIYLSGGTVTEVKIPDNNGTTIFTATPCTLHLGPGETFSMTYSSVPNMRKQVH